MIARRIFWRMWRGKLEVAYEVFDDVYVTHGLGVDVPPGPEGTKQFASLYRGPFSDLWMTVDDQVGEGDRVVTQQTARGTHEGGMMGIQAMGKRILVLRMTVNRLVGDTAMEGWNNWDGLARMQQPGAVAPAGRSGS
jgi:predicted ester cyclase